MNILVLGSGGREHAIAWKLKQSQHIVYLHPGNAGTLQKNIPNLGAASTLTEIIEAAQEKQITLIVIGPEALLAKDYASQLRQKGFWVVGPGKSGALLETSKIFAKEFMNRAKVPTAAYTIYENWIQFKSGMSQGHYPRVLKLDGLAAGKGVVIPQTKEEALNFGRLVWEKNIFKTESPRVLQEEFIKGVELSYLGLCDGVNFIPLSSSTDFKRVFDYNKGPNTGGMGAVSPSPYLTPELEQKIQERIVNPILNTLTEEKMDFRGVLYIGIMIDQNQDPFVLEFNTRFGDPETQSLMLRIENDFGIALMATAQGALKTTTPIKWSSQTAIYVVGAAPGYPENPQTGSPISGLEDDSPQTQLFFAGVEQKEDELITAGGRVLGVGALGKDAQEARTKAYERLKKVSWDGIHYRTDIGLTD